ncbi:MAG: PqqD family protein [Acutalibacteraceae bacterium]
MNIKKELVLREIMGENVLVPCAEAVISNNGLFMLNETGLFIWKILPEVSDEKEILQRLLEEYDIDPKQAKADISNFLSALRDYEIID